MIKGLNFSVDGITPQTLRLAFLLGYFMYGMFGILDLFVYHENQPKIWFIRFGVIYPALTIYMALTYTKFFYRYVRIFILVLLITGQTGLMLMLIYSNPGEIAFYSYYGGLILVILWSSFIFRFNFRETLYVSIFTIILYNVVAIFFQGYFITIVENEALGWYYNNNYFLVSSSILSLIGAYLLEKHEKEIVRAHKEITVEKKALEDALVKVEESNNLKTAFLKNLNHEIRTPMNGILGFNNLIKLSTNDETLSQYTQIIESSGNRMMNTINELIEMSLIITNNCSIKKSEFQIKTIFENIEILFKKDFEEKSIKFIPRLFTKTETLLTDMEKLESIICKLVENGIKFTKAGGIVELSLAEANGNLIIKVSDNGIGIPKDKLNNIFQSFVQADTSDNRGFEGNGLGLSIAKGYVDLLGGIIGVESVDGKGSVFTVQLPINP